MTGAGGLGELAATEPRLLFFWKFLREGRRVASVAPSSRSLSRAATSRVDPSRPQVIVELGAGTGPVTECALARCHPQSRLVAIELDADFASILSARCPRATVIRGDALDLPRHLESAGVGRIDLLISGLALPSLATTARRAVVNSFREFATAGAWFSQLTIMPLVYRPLYRRLFREVRFEWALWNAPPAGVYHCREARA